MVEAFTKETGIDVAMTRKSAGETFAQIKAEASNPRGDVWWGGTGDPHLQAAEAGLTEEYKSPMLAELLPWAQSQAEATVHKTVGLYAGAPGFGYNEDMLTPNNIPVPKYWADTNPPTQQGRRQTTTPH